MSRLTPASRPRGRAGLEAAPANQRFLSQAQRGRRYLEQFVVTDPLEALLEAHDPCRGEPDPLVGRGGAHVGEALFLGDVHVEVVLAHVLAHYLALIDGIARPHEEGAARLEMV